MKPFSFPASFPLLLLFSFRGIMVVIFSAVVVANAVAVAVDVAVAVTFVFVDVDVFSVTHPL